MAGFTAIVCEPSNFLADILSRTRLLDHGLATWYAWFATVWHGISAGAMYPAAGYVVTAYSPEQLRGRYIASMWASQLAGGIVGSGTF